MKINLILILTVSVEWYKLSSKWKSCAPAIKKLLRNPQWGSSEVCAPHHPRCTYYHPPPYHWPRYHFYALVCTTSPAKLNVQNPWSKHQQDIKEKLENTLHECETALTPQFWTHFWSWSWIFSGSCMVFICLCIFWVVLTADIFQCFVTTHPNPCNVYFTFSEIGKLFKSFHLQLAFFFATLSECGIMALWRPRWPW